MAGKNYDEAVDAIKDALDGIPGPQQGETEQVDISQPIGYRH